MVVAQADASDCHEQVEVLVSVDVRNVVTQAIRGVNCEHIRQCAGHFTQLLLESFGLWPRELSRAKWLHWLQRVPLLTVR